LFYETQHRKTYFRHKLDGDVYADDRQQEAPQTLDPPKQTK